MTSISDFEIENGVLKKYRANSAEVYIPEGVTEIGKNAFLGKTGIQKIHFPESLEKISDSAFSPCPAITELTFPSRLQSIGEEAFSGCYNLKNLTFPENLKEIGKRAFYACVEIKSVSIPPHVTIGNEAFCGCTGLVRSKFIVINGILFDCYYDLNDDMLIKDILAGAYSGRADGHTNQLLYPLGLILSGCYFVLKSLPVFGLFMSLCFGVSFLLILYRKADFPEKILPLRFLAEWIL